jgi:hypothetical protein
MSAGRHRAEGDRGAAGAALPRDGGAGVESITLEPAPSAWRLRAHSPDAAAQRFRDQLGLPRGPIVMSGHQAGLWHCGIAAKWFALEAMAQRAGAQPVWLVVDTDDNEPTVLSYPARRVGDGEGGPEGEGGRLERRQWQAAPGALVRPGTPTGSREAIDPAPAPESGRTVEVLELARAGLQRAAAALRAHRGAGSLAEQFALAAADVVGQAAGGGSEAARLVFASAIGRTELFADIVRRMVDDPVACVRAYNDAAAARPEAQLRALELDERGGRIELPLWRIEPGSPRQAVYAADLKGNGGSEGSLAPRALLLTGLMRLAGCELFIHGTGGGVYDQVTGAWLGAWLGASGGLELAPSVVASATWLLPLSDEPPPAPGELARAQWARHAARHNPSLVGDRAAAARKRELVGAIAEAEPGDVRRASLYREMHELLEQVRGRRAGDIARLEARAADLRQRLRDGDILLDRTWSIALFPPERLRELRSRIHEALA